MVVMPGEDAPVVAQPSKEAFDLPALPIAAQRPPILRWKLPAVDFMRSDHLNPLGLEGLIQGIGVVGFVTDETDRLPFYKSVSESGFHKGRFVGGSARHATGDRKTRAVCHCHELRAFAPLGFSDAEPPFLAATKVPSMKHSERFNPPRSFKSSARVRRTAFRVPDRTHCWNRRWQVWWGGNSSGRSCQAAPVRRIQRTPSNTSRVSLQGRPRPSIRRGSGGINGLIFSHCSSVSRRDKVEYLAFYSAISDFGLHRNHSTDLFNGFMR
jgi:hypothetical protein